MHPYFYYFLIILTGFGIFSSCVPDGQINKTADAEYLKIPNKLRPIRRVRTDLSLIPKEKKIRALRTFQNPKYHSEFNQSTRIFHNDESLKLYEEQYLAWMALHGSMENVPKTILEKYPNGYQSLITDGYSKAYKYITYEILSRCKPVDGFDMPVGAPDGKKYLIAQRYGVNDHLGEDWNGVGGGNTDFGDPVYSVADGVIYWAKVNPGSWGNIVRIVHNVGTTEKPDYLETLYAHLDTMIVKEGQQVIRGQQIGTIGDANGHYSAHLHFEVRKNINTPIGSAYGTDTAGVHYLPPYPFLRDNRPKLWEKRRNLTMKP